MLNSSNGWKGSPSPLPMSMLRISPRRVVHVLEEEPVYAAKLFQRPFRRWEILSQNGGAGGAEIVLRSRQRILVRGAHKVPQHVRSWNQVGIEDTRHRHSNP